jgi:hypothetical protein
VKSVKSMAAGDPEAVGVMKKSVRDKLQEFKESLPGRGDRGGSSPQGGTSAD